MNKLVSILFVASACSASVDGGDDTGGMDPGGDAGTNDPGEMTESATVRFLFTTVRDERGDTIDFTSGEPVHTHAGPAVTIGGTICPDVYKYSYLLDAAAPKFGRETSPNPFTWQVELKNTKSLDLAASAYRVRASEPGEWRPLPALADDVSTITLTRDVIGDREGEYFLDIRTLDKQGAEVITSACFRLHPITAPIEVQPARAEPTGLIGMSLPADSPISMLFHKADVPVFAQRIVHHTAEPVLVTIDLAQPTATYTKRVVRDYVVAATHTGGDVCVDHEGQDTGAPMCNAVVPADPADSTASGALESAVWTLGVIDEATDDAATACTVTGLSAQCQLPARALTESAKSFVIVLSMRRATELEPSTPFLTTEHTIAGKTFTGLVLDTVERCTEFKTITKLGQTIVTCAKYDELTQIHALDNAQLAFDAVTFALATSSSTGAPQPIVHAPPALQTIAPFTWDAGDDDLPGPQ